ncbi:RidA family protein [Pandoraea nosoerga]|uniref:Endoribonuclease L-PSP n=1 Tax=Pandoraea nosoerga TaxID=2508296 RepID=A0A5E4RPV0_9BURK|nr:MULTISPECIES: RidA family protein [Pandoraea]MBN4664512.1 RidA family protein [Pandoraea nosoerga]MBN4674452.1 RidA family protein [Pandoraea nosoerga]MBN4679720.1 RidA family protein [Pandoraea nosoerga]MBN4743192.1 RidA family protein [Pandoraea nosoerga]VVD63898.1 endoribonuclease L-PSP [Pandoraea nosoerga]
MTTRERGIEAVNVPTLPPPRGHYSHGVCANGFVFVSGQLPITPEGERLAGAPFAVQARQALDNVAQILTACGTRIDRLVQVRVYITNADDWGPFNEVYAAWAGDARPARCVVPVPALSHGVAVEIEATALAG